MTTYTRYETISVWDIRNRDGRNCIISYNDDLVIWKIIVQDSWFVIVKPSKWRVYVMCSKEHDDYNICPDEWKYDRIEIEQLPLPTT